MFQNRGEDYIELCITDSEPTDDTYCMQVKPLRSSPDSSFGAIAEDKITAWGGQIWVRSIGVSRLVY